MISAPIPANENDRLNALRRFNILDTEPEESFDELTELASAICGTPISLISLIDSERQWFKSRVGIDAEETSRNIAFCAHAILQEDVFVVEDALEDTRFADNPLVASDPNIRFYAGAPLRATDGEMLGTLCVIDREPKKLTRQQAQALQVLARQVINQFELRLSIRRLKNLATELGEINATKDKFFSIIAHDLRAPFNGIIGLSDLLVTELETMPPEECLEMAQDLSSSAEAAMVLMENLLEWASNETGEVNFAPEELNIKVLAEKVVSILSGNATKKGITLTVKGSDKPMAFGDGNMVSSILQNLLSNAIKFTPKGGAVTVTIEDHAALLAVDVSDTGVGMDADQIQKIFQIENASSSKGTDGEEGTGLGLLLCQQFIKKNGGDLTVHSDPGKGSCFRFTLPHHTPA